MRAESAPGGALCLLVLAWLGLSALAPAALAAEAAGDDEIIILQEGPLPSGDDGIIILDEDESIIILEEGSTASSEVRAATGALGRLWETWHVAADSEMMGWGQLVPPDDGALRGLASLWLETWLLPAPNLSLYANGFARAAVDATPGGRVVPFADLYEAYAKVNVDRAAVTFGRIVVPWGRTQAAALGDRVSPADFRRGPPFPDPVRQKQPQWGTSLRTSLGSVGVEGVALVGFEPSEGSLAAANQGGARVARYQTAIVRSPARVGGLFSIDDTRGLQATYHPLESATVAGRAWRRVGDLDLSGSVVVGRDPTARLSLDPAVARAAAVEVLSARGVDVDAASPCGSTPTASCLGGAGAVTYDRTTSFSADVSWGLGVVILRAEGVLWPSVLGGRQAHLVGRDGLSSKRVSQFAGALAVEGALGDSIDGSIEVFDVVWDGIPRQALLHGVELFTDDTSAERMVHRFAGAARLGGSFFGERVNWRLQGEAGILQPDVLASAEVRVRLPVLNLYIGGRADAFFGLAGSPGWMRQDASLIGVFVGEGG